jgi:hypothetical protein
MKATIEDFDVLKAIQPQQVIAYLQAHGWRERKQIADGNASVWEKQLQLLLPLDQEFDDYPLRMSKVLQTLEIAEQRSQFEIWQELTGDSLNNLKAKENSGSVTDLIVAGASTVLSAFPLTAAVGGIGSFALFTWQRENQKKFEYEIKNRIENLDKNKLEQSVLQSDEFKSLVIGAVEIASKSASKIKRQALANLLVNLTLNQAEQFTGEEIALRLISQLSDEEILAITAIYKILKKDSSKQAFGVSIADIKQETDLGEEETRTVCEGLIQLNLIFEPKISSNQYLSLNEIINVRAFNSLLISDLGYHLIKSCQEVTFTEQSSS